MILTKRWCTVSNSHNNNSKSSTMDLIHVFSNHSDEEEIYLLTVNEIAEEQIKDKGLQQQKVTSNSRKLLLKTNMCSAKMVK